MNNQSRILTLIINIVGLLIMTTSIFSLTIDTNGVEVVSLSPSLIRSIIGAILTLTTIEFDDINFKTKK